MNHKITSSILGTLSLSDAFVAVCTAGKLSSNIYSTNSQSSLLSSHTSKNQQVSNRSLFGYLVYHPTYLNNEKVGCGFISEAQFCV